MEMSAVSQQIAMTRLNFAQSAVKSNAQAEQAIVNVLTQSAEALSANGRGSNVNIVA